MMTQSAIVPRTAACCCNDNNVRASNSAQNGANIVYAAEWIRVASAAGRPVSAFRIGVAPTMEVARTRMAASAAKMEPIELLENLTAGNLFCGARRGDCDMRARVRRDSNQAGRNVP